LILDATLRHYNGKGGFYTVGGAKRGAAPRGAAPVRDDGLTAASGTRPPRADPGVIDPANFLRGHGATAPFGAGPLEPEPRMNRLEVSVSSFRRVRSPYLRPRIPSGANSGGERDVLTTRPLAHPRLPATAALEAPVASATTMGHSVHLLSGRKRTWLPVAGLAPARRFRGTRPQNGSVCIPPDRRNKESRPARARRLSRLCSLSDGGSRATMRTPVRDSRYTKHLKRIGQTPVLDHRGHLIFLSLRFDPSSRSATPLVVVAHGKMVES
jgi:hypothetical protein